MTKTGKFRVAIVGIVACFGVNAFAQNAQKEALKAFFQKGAVKASGARQIGTLSDKRINESSGLAYSRTTPGVLWTHNDSGDGPYIYAINLKGKTLARYTVSGASNSDWEAMSIGPGRGGKPAIYIGDVGDNGSNRDDAAIYRIPEPRVNIAKTKDELDTTVAEKFPYRFPDGARNCETVLVHPQTGKVFLITKMPDGVSGIYAFPMPLRPNERVTLKKLGTVSFPSGFSGRLGEAERLISDGAFSPDGRRVILRNYLTAYEWTIAPNQSLQDALKGTRRQRTLPLLSQGEAICYRPDGKAVYITSENKNSPLYEVPLN